MVWKGAIAVRRYFLLLILSAALLLTACGKTTQATWQEQYDLGVKYFDEGNYEEAVIAFTAAIDIDPRRPEAYGKAAEAYEALGRVDEARELLEEALERIEDETLRQLYLYQLLDLPAPSFTHAPLLLDSRGRRLSKRDADAGLEVLRDRMTPEEILGKLAYLAGFHPSAAPASAEALLGEFHWDKVPRQDIPIPEGLFN